MTWEFDFLYALQSLHQPWLNPIMIFVSKIGEAGAVWVAISLVLLFFRKTRRCGIAMLFSMILTFVLGNLVLKNLIARPRPCMVDSSVALLVPFPSEFSFPSGHTMNGFTAAATIFLCHRKAGAAALLGAALIAFSRMYLFVHFPTDILGGILIGVLDAILVYFLYTKRSKRAC